jgi:hypothetical protein
MDPMNIILRRDKTDFAPREVVEGTLQWRLGNQPQRIDVSLLWYTSGKGTQDVGAIETLAIEEPNSVGQRDFAFTLPDGPYSFSGKLVSVAWAVEAASSPGSEKLSDRKSSSPPPAAASR